MKLLQAQNFKMLDLEQAGKFSCLERICFWRNGLFSAEGK